MTHGDKAKAKAGKSSQASAVEKSSTPVKEAGVKSAAGKGGGKSAPQGASKAGDQGKISIRKSGAEKGSAASAGEKGASSGKEGGGAKAAKGPIDEVGSFSNPAVANAFRRAIQRYPNAFRKLTD